jgi:hypothetical protein
MGGNYPQKIVVRNSKHLKSTFDKSKSLFRQEWNHNSPLTIIDFQSEMRAFRELFEEFRPNNVLWIQKNFTTNLTNEDQMWIEDNINKDCLKWGLKKCAFVVGKDLMSQMLVFNFFQETDSCINPKHFGSEKEAMDWIIFDKLPNAHIFNDFHIKFNGTTEEGKSSFVLETYTQNTEATLKTLSNLLKENAFLKENTDRFFTLTNREKEVFKLYANGEGFKSIADKLFLSELTVRTHWRNAKKKLNIKSLSDISDYKNSFLS